MEKPRKRLSILYLIVIAFCVISLSFSFFLGNSIWAFWTTTRTIETKNLVRSIPPPPVTVTTVDDDSFVVTSRNGSFPSASRSKSLTADHEREAGIREATSTTATTTAAASADLEREAQIAASATATVTARAGDVFVPGSLNMTRFEAHQRCYVDEVLYEHHRRQPASRYVSEKHKLIYFQITKAGSSTTRKLLQDSFDILQYSCNKLQRSNATTRFNTDVFHKFTFSREPSSRFVSAFSEVMFRWFMKPESIGSRAPPTKELEDFVRVYNKTYLKEEVGHEVDAFETFVTNHYDGYTIPDNHLRLQIAQIFRPVNCLRLDVIHDLEDLDDVFHELLKEHGLDTQKFETEEKKKNQQVHARRSILHLNISMVSVEVQQKVCQLSALDYCCLNYRLPPECEGVLSCRWRETKTSEWANSLLKSNHSSYSANTNKNMSKSTSASTSTSINGPMLMIEAVSPYPLLPTQRQKRRHLEKDSEKRKLFTPAE